MKVLVSNPHWSWTIRVALAFLALAVITGFSFFQGIFYANRRATVRMASDGCIFSLNALTPLDQPVNREPAPVLDLELDLSGAALAEMSLNYPRLVDWSHYNLLVKVREYRRVHGRVNRAYPSMNQAEVDKKISQAIAYLESIHNTNDWFHFKSQGDDIIRDIRK